MYITIWGLQWKMAQKQQIVVEQIHGKLRPFILQDVRRTGKTLGGGSYGVVEELLMAGLVCAGKKMYDTLIDPRNQGSENMVDKYYKECSLLSELRHPHIVQFLGICFFPDSRLPVIVMERLQTSLDDFLEQCPEIPLPVKQSILHDVAKGLVFLHTRSPVVVHRDLTARNVLLDEAVTAKIADMGNSRITGLRPGQLAQTMTKGIPGTLVYMPPEASTDQYGPPLDMFSFGHLSLFAAIQVFPGELLPSTYTDTRGSKVKGRTELERRERYMITLEGTLGKKHGLVTLVKECLANNPRKRPTASQTLDRMKNMLAAKRSLFNSSQLGKSLTAIKAEAQARKEVQELNQRFWKLHETLERSSRGKDKREKLSKKSLFKKPQGLRVSHMDLRKDRVLTPVPDRVMYDSLKPQSERISQEREEDVIVKPKVQQLSELEAVDYGPAPVKEKCNSPEVQKEEKLSADVLTISEQPENESQMKVPKVLPDILTHRLSLKWKDTTKVPLGAMAAQAVVMGKKFYFGGGEMCVKQGVSTRGMVSGSHEDVNEDCLVLECNMTEEGPQWRAIVAPTAYFSMGAVDNQLIIAGGGVSKYGPSDKVSVLDGDNETWTQPFPAMPTAKFWPSAIGYKWWLVVAGGMAGDEYLNVVEVLDTSSKFWYKASPLPTCPTCQPPLAIIQDTLYIAWEDPDNQPFFAQIPISTLISKATALTCNEPGPSEWKLLPATLTCEPALVSFHGHLLAVGDSTVPSSTIAMYLPHIQQWQKVAELPTSRAGCACCFLPATKELMVVGGYKVNEDKLHPMYTMEACELDAEC